MMIAISVYRHIIKYIMQRTARFTLQRLIRRATYGCDISKGNRLNLVFPCILFYRAAPVFNKGPVAPNRHQDVTTAV